MYTFRFNPVFKRWVLLGGPIHTPERVDGVPFLDIGRSKDFAAIVHPRQPFVIDPPLHSTGRNENGLAFASQPPVGEYELLLYKGYKPFFEWDASIWETWAKLIQLRVKQFHHNHHLHSVSLVLLTSALETVEPYQRVGDLIATSHPITDFAAELPISVADKIHQKEEVFHIIDEQFGRLYIPSAPLHDKELWYIPTHYQSGFEQVNTSGIRHFSQVMAAVVQHLHFEYPHDQFTMTLHAALIDGEQPTTWWLQIHKTEGGVPNPLPVRPLPELFLRELQWSLKRK